MGVTGLWKLIEPTGKPVPLETLENKVLAVDISIWLHQVVKGFQDNKGNTLAHAHLLGLFHRLCKLLYYRIRPVFVFDGGVPILKRETMAKRGQSKNKLLNEADRLQALLLQTLAKEKVVQQALGPNATEILKSPPKLLALRKDDKDDMFKLPDLPATIKKTPELNVSASSYTTTDLSAAVDEKNRCHAYIHNLQVVDVTGNQFKSLPPDVRHEILTDIKETRKQSSWGRLHELPTKSDDFSSFQMKRLLKRRQVQVCLEEAEKQMGGKSLTLNELQTFLTEEGVITAASAVASTSRQIASDENTRFLLVRDLKKAIEAATKKEEDQCSHELSRESKKKMMKKNENDGNLGDEYDSDLQKAIQMSLECCNDSVYDDKDYGCSEIKMSRNQRQLLKDATTSLAKAYLIEYGGVNEDEIKEMLEQTQRSQNENDDKDELSASFNLQFNDKFILQGEMYRHMKMSLGNESAINTSKDLELNDQKIEVKKTKDSKMVKESEFYGDIEFMSDSDDSDLVEVAEKEDPSPEKPILKNDEEKQIENKIQITIDLTQKLDKNNDIFADVFENENKASFSDEEEHTKSINSKMNKEHLKSLIEENDKSENKTSKLDSVLATTDSDEKMKILDKNSVKLTKTEITKPENILKKLQKELEDIKKVTSDDIDLRKDTEKEMNGMHRKILNIDDTSCDHLLKIKKQNSEAKSILKSLKEKITEVSKINLDDIKIDESLSISNLKGLPHPTEIQKHTEIIEITDNDHTLNSTPSKRIVKQETISNYFETQYSIKRTPDKIKEEADKLQYTPKTKSPFFVRKSPRSSGKKNRGKPDILENNDSMSTTKREKVSKSLFDSPKDQTKKDNDDDITPIENPIEIAVNTLKENKTEQELKSIASDIAKEKRELEHERNRQNRMGTSITDKMSYECMQLLKLFGIPYIVAPMEAEAQCAFLNAVNLTDGTITDDSDIWLFGGRKVYKNFFNQQKHVLEFEVEKIEKLFNVDRKKLIQLAILVGSDYTTGITGIGAVTALEILATFPPTPFKEGETSEIVSVLSSLKKFHEWWRNSKSTAIGGKPALRGKLKNIEITEGFPNIQVVEAYLNPKVNMSREKFTWGTPDVETIREFTKKNLGWTKSKTDDILQPVLNKLNEKKTQATLKNYFTVKSAVNVRELKVSKRVQKAIDKLSLDPNKAILENEEDPKSIKTRVRKRTKTKTETALASTSAADDECSTPNEKTEPKKRKRRDKSVNKEMNVDVDTKTIPTPSNKTSKPNLTRLLAAGGPFTTDVIPQRERNLKEMQRKKEKAVEILRKAKEINKGKSK